MTYRFSKRSLDNLSEVHPSLTNIAHEAIEITPIDFGVTCGLRDRQTQYDLYKKKKSKLNGIPRGHRASINHNGEVLIIEGTGTSRHQRQASGYSQAIDIVPYINGKISWKINDFIPVLELFKTIADQQEIKLRFGAGWFYGHKFNSIEEGYKDSLRRGKWIDAPHIEYRGKL